MGTIGSIEVPNFAILHSEFGIKPLSGCQLKLLSSYHVVRCRCCQVIMLSAKAVVGFLRDTNNLDNQTTRQLDNLDNPDNLDNQTTKQLRQP